MHRDRLSELPLSLIHDILSFLPIRDVVKTTLLSKHWVHLWTTVPCISICLNEEEDKDEWDVRTERFRKLVNGALTLWKGTNIQKFSINIEDDSLDVHSSLDDIRACTLFALKNKVEVLKISAFPEYLVPEDVYLCSSITRLSLWYCNVGFRGTPSWNQLKSLTLQILLSENSIEDLVNQIMLGSPVLEVFKLDLQLGILVDLNIMSRSLKCLRIINNGYFALDGTSLDTLNICCPNLETLTFHGLFKCLFTDVSSLTSATLDFFSASGICYRGLLVEFLGETMKQICSTIQNVEKLTLTDLCVQAFGASRKKHLLSPLPNVMFLKLDVRKHGIEFGDVIDLLGIFPNLKSVKINDLASAKRPVFNTVKCMEFETKIPKSFLLQLKIVEINARSCYSSISGFIEFLLKQAVILEKLVIWLKGITLVEHKRFSEKLLTMSRSSPTARVILKSD